MFIIVAIDKYTGTLKAAINPTVHQSECTAKAVAQKWAEQNPGNEYIVMKATVSVVAKQTYSTKIVEKSFTCC